MKLFGFWTYPRIWLLRSRGKIGDDKFTIEETISRGSDVRLEVQSFERLKGKEIWFQPKE